MNPTPLCVIDIFHDLCSIIISKVVYPIFVKNDRTRIVKKLIEKYVHPKPVFPQGVHSIDSLFFRRVGFPTFELFHSSGFSRWYGRKTKKIIGKNAILPHHPVRLSLVQLVQGFKSLNWLDFQ